MKYTKIFSLVFLLSGFHAYADSTTAGSAVGGTSITGSMMPSTLPENQTQGKTQFPSETPVQDQTTFNSDTATLDSSPDTSTDEISTQDSSTSTITCVTNESNDSVCGSNAEKFCNSHPDSDQCSTQEITFE